MKLRRRLVAALLALILLGGCLSHDLFVPVSRQYSTRIVLLGIRAYRHYVSPSMGVVVHCRFQPTCSAYGLASVEKYGAWKGGWRTLRRIVRCNPLTPDGTVDPP